MRGEVWLVNLDPTIGAKSERRVHASCRPAPFRIGVTHGGQRGLILLDQIRAVDKVRLARKLGAVSAKTFTDTLNTLQEVFTE
jgi:mRNA interferase MazF